MYKAIIFDVGDTLVHYNPDKAKVITNRLKEIGVNIDSESAKRIDTNIELCTAEQIFREINGAPRMNDEDFWNMIDNTILDDESVSRASLNETQLIDFEQSRYRFRQEKIVDCKIYELLKELKNSYSLGIISNYSAELKEYLDEKELSGYFSSIIISDIVGFEKPDVRIFELSAKELNCSPSDCLYVGDHPFDVLGSVNAGMDVAWINHKFNEMPNYISYKPTYVLSDVMEIKNIL